jgi:heme-degrading monooxygenase HmoA
MGVFIMFTRTIKVTRQSVDDGFSPAYTEEQRAMYESLELARPSFAGFVSHTVTYSEDKLVQTIVQVWDSQEAYEAFAISDLMKRELVATIKDTYRATKNIVREETSVTA